MGNSKLKKLSSQDKDDVEFPTNFIFLEKKFCLVHNTLEVPTKLVELKIQECDVDQFLFLYFVNEVELFICRSCRITQIVIRDHIENCTIENCKFCEVCFDRSISHDEIDRLNKYYEITPMNYEERKCLGIPDFPYP